MSGRAARRRASRSISRVIEPVRVVSPRALPTVRALRFAAGAGEHLRGGADADAVRLASAAAAAESRSRGDDMRPAPTSWTSNSRSKNFGAFGRQRVRRHAQLERPHRRQHGRRASTRSAAGRPAHGTRAATSPR